jgi:hypothetical protein
VRFHRFPKQMRKYKANCYQEMKNSGFKTLVAKDQRQFLVGFGCF